MTNKNVPMVMVHLFLRSYQMKSKLEKINQQTNNKFLNLYEFIYSNGDKLSSYYVASRRNKEDLVANNGPTKPDAIRILPYYVKDDNIYIVLTKEFRHPLNRYVYSTPAGRVEIDENPEDTVARELMEEIGAKTLKVKELATPGYSSVGLTDESIACYICEVELTGKQHLEESENIEYFSIPFKDALRFAKEEVQDLQAKLVLMCFYYEKLNEMKKTSPTLDK